MIDLSHDAVGLAEESLNDLVQDLYRQAGEDGVRLGLPDGAGGVVPIATIKRVVGGVVCEAFVPGRSLVDSISSAPGRPRVIQSQIVGQLLGGAGRVPGLAPGSSLLEWTRECDRFGRFHIESLSSSGAMSRRPWTPRAGQLLRMSNPGDASGLWEQLDRPGAAPARLLLGGEGEREVIAKRSGKGRHEALALAAEHAALTVMRRKGLPAARSQFYRQPGSERAVLMVDRFDRAKRGVMPALSALTLNQILTGAAGLEYAAANEQAALLAGRHLHGKKGRGINDQIARRVIFSRLIGNEDLNGDNISYLVDPSGDAATLQLAPAYDISPSLMGLSGAEMINERAGRGRPLVALGPDDVRAGNRFLEWHGEIYPGRLEALFAEAKACQMEFLREVSGPMVECGALSAQEAGRIRRFLSDPVGMVPVHEKDRNPFSAVAKAAFGTIPGSELEEPGGP